MNLWRVHVELDDRPGRLGELATAIGACGCNILALHVVGEPTDHGTVTDEVLVRFPDGAEPAELVEALSKAGFVCTLLVRTDVSELADPATTALALARMVAADPGSAPRAVATLLRAQLVDPAAPNSALSTHTLRVGTQVVHLGRAWPFTATELSRAAALLQLADQLELGWRGLPQPERILLLRDGSEVCLRPATPADTPLVAALHARCSPESRRARFLDPSPHLPVTELNRLVGGDDGYALLALTTDCGSAVGLANVDTIEDGRAQLAVLVDDAWQGRGLGTALVRRAVEAAAERGAAEIVGVARVEDVGITRLLRRAGLRPSAEIDGRVVRIRAPLEAPALVATS